MAEALTVSLSSQLETRLFQVFENSDAGIARRPGGLCQGYALFAGLEPIDPSLVTHNDASRDVGWSRHRRWSILAHGVVVHFQQ